MDKDEIIVEALSNRLFDFIKEINYSESRTKIIYLLLENRKTLKGSIEAVI